MVRHSIVVVACALAVAGCDRAPNFRNELAAETARPLAVVAPEGDMPTMPPAAQQFSYTHAWSVIMARETVAPRFTRARDLCLRDKSLNCKLVFAKLASGEYDPGSVSGSIEVQLPHAKLDIFERALMAPVKGEAVRDAVMQARSSQAQSVETQAGDTARKVAQLTAYRDRLADIAKRPNLSVDDIIKLESERARVQTELDEATGLQRTLTDGIAREDVTITLTGRTPPIKQVGVFARFLDNAGSTLTDSAEAALLFAIGAIPWLPVIAVVIWLVSRLWRWLLQRRTIRVAISRGLGTEPAPPSG